MNPPRLLGTTAVRLALRYVLVYVLLLSVVAGVLYWSTGWYVDTRQEEDLVAEFDSLVRVYSTLGAEGLAAEVSSRSEARLRNGFYYLLSDASGYRVAGSMHAWPVADDPDDEIVVDGLLRRAWVDEEILPDGLYDDDARLPLIARELPGGERLLLVGASEQSEALYDLAEFLLEVVGISVLLALAMSIVLGRTILKRMDVVGRTAGDIMAGDLSRRIPVSGRNDEFDALSRQLNAMLDRIDQLVQGIRAVTDNIAHDLRSPLTRMRNRMEVVRLEPREPAEYCDALDQSIEDADSLIRTFNALLSIAQAEAGNHRTEWKPFDIHRLVTDLADLYQPLVEEKGQVLELGIPKNGPFTGSRDLLTQAIGNLLENAVKYTPAGGKISLTLTHRADGIDITVMDSGPGIPAGDRERVLDRFVRLDSARNTPGNGLGLSLVKAVAALHGGDLLLEDAAPGLSVTIRLPHLSVP